MKIAEATLVMPVAVLLTISLIGLMMTFYGDLLEQTETNRLIRNKLYEMRECTYIRACDKAEDMGKE